MKITYLLVVMGIALLSIAAGLAKVMQTQQEMEFLQGLGLSTTMIVVFGLVQIAGGMMMASKKTRVPGVIVVLLAFVVSTVLIAVGGTTGFALMSLIPIALAGVVLYQTVKINHNG